jgi:hypothetical protein
MTMPSTHIGHDEIFGSFVGCSTPRSRPIPRASLPWVRR